MKIKEKLAGVLKRVRHPQWVAVLKDSQSGQMICQVWGTYRANPFPAQVLLIFLYRLALDFMYITQISPLYVYAGFTTDLVPLRYLCSLAAVVVFSPFVAALHEDPRPSSTLVTFLHYLYFIPLTSYCGCKGTSPWFFGCVLAYWAVLLVLQAYLPTVQLKPLSLWHSQKLFALLTVFSVLFVLFISGRYTGFRFTLDFINVYDVRAEAASYQIPRILRYLLSFMTMILSVLLFYWLQNRRYVAAGVVFVVFLFYFSIAANKSDFFFLVLILGCYAIYRRWMLRWAAGFLTAGVAAAWLMEKVLHFVYPMSFFVRRLMYIPAQLSETYAAFFQENPLNLFRYGIMGKLSFDSIYSASIPVIIGEFEGGGSNANNGMLGDMFANLPAVLGVFLMPLILVVCFRLLDLASKGLPQKITISFCAYFAISFMNTSWSIVLLSHGFLLACLLLYAFPRKEEQPL